MIWACSAATGPGHLAVIEFTMNSSVYQSILESNVRPSVWQLKLGWNWVINRTMIPNTNRKQKESRCSRCSSQSPDLKVIEMLWWDLKRAVHKPMVQTKATLQRRASQNSSITRWETDNIIQKIVPSSNCSLKVVLQAVESWGILSMLSFSNNETGNMSCPVAQLR